MTIRTLTILAVVAAIASPAAAEIKVNIVGKDASVVEAEIVKAAKTVCRHALLASPVSMYTVCVEVATADAMDQLSSARATYGKASTPVEMTRVSAAK